jgi:hypothetical protein
LPAAVVRQAAREAGLTVADRTLKAWLDGRRSPSAKHLRNTETAYLQYAGTTSRGTCSPVSTAKAAGTDDGQALDDAWINDAWINEAWINEAVVDLGSQRGRYAYVTAIGFAA